MSQAPQQPTFQSQGALNIPASFKPFNKKGTFNPNVEMNSSLNRANKRLPYAPTNFIGVNSIRPDNLQPTRTYNPSGIKGPYTPKVPILHTMPVQAKYQ